MSGFNISLSGMRAQSSAIEVTSDNVANASTVGFKSGNYQFVDQFFRALQTGGAGGVSGAGIERRQAQGALKPTTSPLDLALQGDGMFRLTSTPGSDAESTLYSRNGQFAVDKQGYLVNANGLYLTGYQPNESLTGVTSTIAAMRLPPTPLAPLPTSEGQLALNLDSRRDAPASEFDPAAVSSYSYATTMRLFDSKGVQHAVQAFFRKIEDAAVDDPRTEGTTTDATATQYQVFLQADGVNLVGDGEAEGALGTDVPAQPVATLQFIDGQLVGSLQRDASGAIAVPTKVGAKLLDAEGNTLLDADIDLSLTTAFGANYEVRQNDADGYAAGALSQVRFDEQGHLFAEYTNGETLLGGQLVLATFPSEYGLTQVSASVFAETNSSGPASLGTGGSGQYGSVRSRALEESNIDLANELVRLMIQQRNYQANAQSFKAAQEMLTTTIQLDR